MVQKLLNMQYVKIDQVESTIENYYMRSFPGFNLPTTVIPMLSINDLPNSAENLSFRIFAYDTS